MTGNPLFHREFALLPTANLRPYERNARQHSAQQLDQIAGAVRTFGWTNPVLVDEADMILAGHGRVEAATTRLGLKEVPCLRITGLSDAEKRALILADNKIALNATWDEAMVAREIADLRALADIGELDLDIGVIGFAKGARHVLADARQGDSLDVAGHTWTVHLPPETDGTVWVILRLQGPEPRRDTALP